MNQINNLQDKAIDQALKGNWEEAININNKIIEIDDTNLDSYLRIGYAYIQVGKYENAKKAFSKALKIQPANQIAKNNLEKVKILSEKKSKKNIQKNVCYNPSLFLQIAGKTKLVPLVNIGQAKALVQLEVGEEVYLKIKKRRIEIRTKGDEYIGAFPDDLSKRIMFFLDAKSEYLIFVKEASKNYVEVFIKEEKKGKKVEKFISFPKDIQESLKNIEENSDNSSESIDEENDKDLPIDLEKLAEELAESETEKEGISAEQFEEEKEDFED